MARSFTSTGDRIEWGTTTPPSTGTMHCWYYPTWNTSTEASPLCALRTYNVSPLRLCDFIAYNGSGDGTYCYFGWYNASASYVDSRYKIPAASVLTQNTWNSVAMTWTNAGATLIYSGGSNVTSGGSYVAGSANCSWVDLTGNANVIGNNPGDYSAYARGELAEFAIWDVILNSTELGMLAAGISPGFIRPASLTRYLPILGGSPEPDFWNSTSGTVTGTTVSNHPNIVRPLAQPQLVLPTTAATGNRRRRVLICGGAG